MRTSDPTDRALIDLRDERTDMAIRVSLLKNSEQPDEQLLFRMQRDLELLDRRIATYKSPRGLDVSRELRACDTIVTGR